MPKPEPGESEKDFLKRCIPELIHEGKPQKQSIAICYSMYRKDGSESKSPKPSRKNNNSNNSNNSNNNNKTNTKELAKLYCYMCDY